MPDKSPDAFRTISEVADWLGVQPHVLRFWESKFSQVRPVKRAGGRRYYRPNDMLLLGGIRKLLHEDGLTIKGAQKVLREEGMSHVARMSQPLDAESAALSDLAAAAEDGAREEHSPSPPAPEPETGQLLDFGSAQRPQEEEPETTPPAETPGPAAEDPKEDPAAAPQPELTAPAAEEPEESGADDLPPPASSEDPPSRAAEDAAPREEPEEEALEQPFLPSFVRHGARKEPAGSGTPEKPAEAKSERPVSDRLPSFLQSPPAEKEAPASVSEAADTEAEAAEAPADLADQTVAETEEAGSPEAPSEPDAPPAPKPRIVDAPDPDESAIDVSTGALSASYSAGAMSPERRAAVLPLVSQLAALRDRMAAARGQ